MAGKGIRTRASTRPTMLKRIPTDFRKNRNDQRPTQRRVSKQHPQNDDAPEIVKRKSREKSPVELTPEDNVTEELIISTTPPTRTRKESSEEIPIKTVGPKKVKKQTKPKNVAAAVAGTAIVPQVIGELSDSPSADTPPIERKSKHPTKIDLNIIKNFEVPVKVLDLLVSLFKMLMVEAMQHKFTYSSNDAAIILAALLKQRIPSTTAYYAKIGPTREKWDPARAKALAVFLLDSPDVQASASLSAHLRILLSYLLMEPLEPFLLPDDFTAAAGPPWHRILRPPTAMVRVPWSQKKDALIPIPDLPVAFPPLRQPRDRPPERRPLCSCGTAVADEEVQVLQLTEKVPRVEKKRARGMARQISLAMQPDRIVPAGSRAFDASRWSESVCFSVAEDLPPHERRELYLHKLPKWFKAKEQQYHDVGGKERIFNAIYAEQLELEKQRRELEETKTGMTQPGNAIDELRKRFRLKEVDKDALWREALEKYNLGNSQFSRGAGPLTNSSLGLPPKRPPAPLKRPEESTPKLEPRKVKEEPNPKKEKLHKIGEVKKIQSVKPPTGKPPKPPKPPSAATPAKSPPAKVPKATPKPSGIPSQVKIIVNKSKSPVKKVGSLIVKKSSAKVKSLSPSKVVGSPIEKKPAAAKRPIIKSVGSPIEKKTAAAKRPIITSPATVGSPKGKESPAPVGSPIVKKPAAAKRPIRKKSPPAESEYPVVKSGKATTEESKTTPQFLPGAKNSDRQRPPAIKLTTPMEPAETPFLASRNSDQEVSPLALPRSAGEEPWTAGLFPAVAQSLTEGDTTVEVDLTPATLSPNLQAARNAPTVELPASLISKSQELKDTATANYGPPAAKDKMRARMEMMTPPWADVPLTTPEFGAEMAEMAESPISFGLPSIESAEPDKISFPELPEIKSSASSPNLDFDPEVTIASPVIRLTSAVGATHLPPVEIDPDNRSL